jgi:formyltetrahydrofolate deformylase
MSPLPNLVVFLISCPDRKGIVSAVSTFFFERGFTIVHCQQHTDPLEGRFFMRMLLDLDSAPCSRADLLQDFERVAGAFEMVWSAHFCVDVTKIAILGTIEPHCLFDLLCRAHNGELASAEIALVISNRTDLESTAAQFRVPFFYCPIESAAKRTQEREVVRLLHQHHVQLAVLARYMQILSGEMLQEARMPIINIHHAFLPAFQGAAPYRRAWERGVKMIGATAHYVTAALDEGPIIEQDVERVTHEDSIDAMSRIGSDIERVVLARAVQAHLEHRVLVHGNRTVVFSRGC